MGKAAQWEAGWTEKKQRTRTFRSLKADVGTISDGGNKTWLAMAIRQWKAS